MEKDLTEIGGIGPRILIVVSVIVIMIGLFYTGVRMYLWGTETATQRLSADKRAEFTDFCSQDVPINGATLYEAVNDFSNRGILSTVIYDANGDMTPDPASSSDRVYGFNATYSMDSLLETIKNRGFDSLYYVTYATKTDGSSVRLVEDDMGNLLMGIIPYGG